MTIIIKPNGGCAHGGLAACQPCVDAAIAARKAEKAAEDAVTVAEIERINREYNAALRAGQVVRAEGLQQPSQQDLKGRGHLREPGPQPVSFTRNFFALRLGEWEDARGNVRRRGDKGAP